MFQALFQELGIMSLSNVDEVCDLKEFVLQWRKTVNKQINI